MDIFDILRCIAYSTHFVSMKMNWMSDFIVNIHYDQLSYRVQCKFDAMCATTNLLSLKVDTSTFGRVVFVAERVFSYHVGLEKERK